MLKPDDIPNAVVDELWKATGDHPVGVLALRHEAKLYLAAAINAWPGAEWRESGHYPNGTSGPDATVTKRIILPLPPKEPRDESHLRPDRRTNVAERLFGDE